MRMNQEQMDKDVESTEQNSSKVLKNRNNNKIKIKIKNKLKSMTRKWKLRILFRTLFFILCSTGLMINTIQLIGDFMSGRTVVNIEYETDKFNEIPGITVCYPYTYSIKGIMEKCPPSNSFDQEFLTNVSNIKKYLADGGDIWDLKNDTESFNKVLSDEYINYLDLTKRKKMSGKSDYYLKVYKSLVEFYKYAVKPTFHQTLDVSIPFKEINYLEGGKTHEQENIFIKVQAMKEHQNGTFDKLEFKDHEPIESIIASPMTELAKCFTFFSHLNLTWRNYQIHIDKIVIKIQYNFKWFPFTRMNAPVKISIHAPDELPLHESDNFVSLRPFRSYEYSYTHWKSEYVGPSYLANCKNYSLDDSQPENRMRSNCLKHCILKRFMECININRNDIEFDRDIIYWTKDLWTKQDFFENDQVEFLQYFNYEMILKNRSKIIIEKCSSMVTQFKAECNRLCEKKCINHYYSLHQQNNQENLVLDQIDSTGIELSPSSHPNQITKYKPEMSPIAFASNFGGLLGMWLGLSALALLNILSESFLKPKKISKSMLIRFNHLLSNIEKK